MPESVEDTGKATKDGANAQLAAEASTRTARPLIKGQYKLEKAGECLKKRADPSLFYHKWRTLSTDLGETEIMLKKQRLYKRKRGILQKPKAPSYRIFKCLINDFCKLPHTAHFVRLSARK